MDSSATRVANVKIAAMSRTITLGIKQEVHTQLMQI